MPIYAQDVPPLAGGFRLALESQWSPPACQEIGWNNTHRRRERRTALFLPHSCLGEGFFSAESSVRRGGFGLEQGRPCRQPSIDQGMSGAVMQLDGRRISVEAGVRTPSQRSPYSHTNPGVRNNGCLVLRAAGADSMNGALQWRGLHARSRDLRSPPPTRGLVTPHRWGPEGLSRRERA